MGSQGALVGLSPGCLLTHFIRCFLLLTSLSYCPTLSHLAKCWELLAYRNECSGVKKETRREASSEKPSLTTFALSSLPGLWDLRAFTISVVDSALSPHIACTAVSWPLNSTIILLEHSKSQCVAQSGPYSGMLVFQKSRRWDGG